jgi:GNAT superfamily N-acetyltransferase
MSHIRSPTVADIPQLCELLSILFTQEADFQPDAAKQSAALSMILAQPERGNILVAEQDGRVLGMVNLLYTVSTACGGKVGLLEDMVVHPEARGEGLGSRLLQAAIESAGRAGCLRVTLLTDRANHAAVRFYQRAGFDLSSMIPLRLMLGQSG